MLSRLIKILFDLFLFSHLSRSKLHTRFIKLFSFYFSILRSRYLNSIIELKTRLVTQTTFFLTIADQ